MAKKENIEPEKVEENNNEVIPEPEKVNVSVEEANPNPVYLVSIIEGNSYSFGSKKKKYVKGVSEKVSDPVELAKLQANGRFKIEKI